MASSVRVEEVIKGKYRVERVLGEGGMGVVLAAWDLMLERRVAIKLMRPEILAHPTMMDRFLREARAAAKIQSEHVAQVVEVACLDDGCPFVVMEYLDGYDLSAVSEAPDLLPIHQVVAYVLEACRAIGEAHGLGIVHRDLKPANLFVARRRDGTTRVKVLDFGISKLADAEGPEQVALTRTSTVMGSPLYMSPEQMLSARNVDARSDIWSLGVILYELCTGRVPFTGETVTAIYATIMERSLVPPRAFRPDLDAGLEAVILGCLEPDRDKRIAGVSALAGRLAPYASPGSGLVSNVVGAAPPQPVRSSATLPVMGMTPPPAGKNGSTTAAVSSGPIIPRAPARARRWPIVAGVVGLVAAVGLGALLRASGRRAPAVALPEGESATEAPTPTGSAPEVTPQPPDAVPSSIGPAASAPSAPAPAAPVPSAPPIGKPHAAVPAAKTAPPAATVSCNPPYVIDSAGIRTRKPECK